MVFLISRTGNIVFLAMFSEGEINQETLFEKRLPVESLSGHFNLSFVGEPSTPAPEQPTTPGPAGNMHLFVFNPSG